MAEKEEEPYDYFNDPEYQPPPEMPQEPDPYKDLPDRALKYKEEGNKLLKSDTPKAIMWYTRAIQTPHKVAEERAVFFCNRCAAHLLMENYRSALEDAEAAVSMKPSAAIRLKALYRGSKAALGCGPSKLPHALKLCREALELKKTRELVALEAEIQQHIKKQLRKQDDKEELKDDKKEMAKLFISAVKKRGWLLGNKLLYQTPYNDAKTIGMGYNDVDDVISMPIILMYPQYRQSDLIQQSLETQTLNEWLEKLFPPGPPLPWDTERLFLNNKLSELVLLVKTNDFPQRTRKQQWVQIDPALPLRDILLCDREYVVPKWPVIFVLHKSYRDKFLSLDITKIS